MKYNKNDFFSMYSNVQITVGYNRSLIADLFTGKIYFVPNFLVDVLKSNTFKMKSIPEVLDEQIDEDWGNSILNFIEFAIENNFGIISNKEVVNCLQEMNFEYISSSEIENSILEISHISKWNIVYVIEQLDFLGTKFIELRFLDFESFVKNFELFANSIINTTIESVYVFVPFDVQLMEFLLSIKFDCIRINKLIIYNAPKELDIIKTDFEINLIPQKSIESNHCGNISPEYFTVNTNSYSFSSNYNNCLAYKISVDQFGNIKNCPSSSNSFGSIDKVSLQTALENTDLKKLWFITKNQVKICSDCEFRMICTDCRIFIDDKNDPYSRTLKCDFNPYISIWSDQDGFKKIEECGISIVNGKVIIDEEKVNQLNSEIW